MINLDKVSRKVSDKLGLKKTMNNIPTVEQSHNLWKNEVKGTTNEATNYTKPMGRSRYLLEQITKYCQIKKDQSILEIGCNVGRNLNYLFHNGYTNLSGIEINDNAVKLLKKTYPELDANIMLGSVEDRIRELKDNEMSLTFSMAVLMHINPKSQDLVFREISRITKSWIITIEKENVFQPPGVFARNYRDVFTSMGWQQKAGFRVEKYDDVLIRGNYVFRIFHNID